MRILYVTDLHGSNWKYDKVFAIAKQQHVSAVINGGDMLPKSQFLETQDIYITEILSPHFKEYAKAGIPYFCMPGNDDLKAFDPLFESICNEHGVNCMANRIFSLGGHEIIGFNLVVDYPFLLKDRCRMDDYDHVFCRQFGKGVLSHLEDGSFCGLGKKAASFITLDDWTEHAQNIPTIKEELTKLHDPADPERAIYVIHMPPSGMGLDVCNRNEAVGSKSVRKFLEKKKPLLALHGHIHESPVVSGTWKVELDGTTYVQPGQMSKLCYAIIDLDTMDIERYEG